MDMDKDLFGALSILLSLAGGVVFLLVARTVAVRPVSQESRRARNAFVTWWAILGGITFAGLLLQLPGATANLGLYLVVLVAMLALLCVGLWGLLFYLVYLFTSRRGLAIPLAVGYVLYFAFLTAAILGAGPTGFEQTPTGQELQYEHPLEDSVLYLPLVLLLVLPPLLAAIGYLSLYWKVDQTVQKRRILLVSLSIIVWFGSSLVSTGLGASREQGWSLASRLISLAAALTIYYAYAALRPGAASPASETTPPGEPAMLYEAPPRKGVSQVLPLGI